MDDDVRWIGKIEGRQYRVGVVDGRAVTESREYEDEPWRAFTRSGFGSTIRETVLEHALVASRAPAPAGKQRRFYFAKVPRDLPPHDEVVVTTDRHGLIQRSNATQAMCAKRWGCVVAASAKEARARFLAGDVESWGS